MNAVEIEEVISNLAEQQFNAAELPFAFLEALIHKFFTSARLDIQIVDRFGQLVTAREWFLVPLFVINEFVDRIKSGTTSSCYYDQKLAKIVSG